MPGSHTLRLPYRLLNVFATEAEFSGNPLCVFEDGSALTSEEMLALARQFNLSETTFILPSESASAGVRIFTPAYEMPFAGHPTLGTSYVVSNLKNLGTKVTLQMAAGIIPVESPQADVWRLTANRPRWRAFEDSAVDLAAALSLSVADIAGPVLWVDSGNDQLLVPVVSEDAVLRAAPHAERLGIYGPTFKTLVFHLQGENARARFFFRQRTGFAEDPATGSACANLGGWILAVNSGAVAEGPHRPKDLPVFRSAQEGHPWPHRPKDLPVFRSAQEGHPWPHRPVDLPVFRLPLSCTVSQGTEVGRPSHLTLAIDIHETITVAGIVRELGRGYVDVKRRA